ncbi:membrane protein insertion efficiency factor YidD [Mariniflexile soesokkakense]|uniref:membrane protein insertion efficiency factor YidD n=1 Tax=Mariniflexile soesokkakense TaxID=1343160 RepID=UPI00360E1B43
MKYLLILIIKLYWAFISESQRRKCLFKISCSNYVYEKATTEGLVSGLKALKLRITNCNSSYNIIKVNNELLLVTSTNKVFKEQEIRKSLLN